jgi:hypothetical protein
MTMSYHSSKGTEVIFYLLIGGPVALFWGLRKLREKRLIENISTSTVRAAAMGLVELSGFAKPRQIQKAPISGMDCCWWNCQVQELRSNGKNSHWATIKEIGSNDFFYLDDMTGRVLINPFGAELRVLTIPSELNSMTRTQIAPVLNGWGLNDMNWFGGSQRLRIIEQVIPDQAPIYVMGQLISTAAQTGDQRARLMAQLRTVKSNSRLMAEADTNKDGQVDAAEWDALRAQQEEAFYKEERDRQAQTPNQDHVLVVAPLDNPFVIATGSEQDFLGALKWQVPLGLFGGVTLSAGGVWVALMNGWPPLFIVGLLAAGVVLGGVIKQFKFNFWGS